MPRLQGTQEIQGSCGESEDTEGGTPCAACGLIAGGDLDLPVALLALDEAAPVELALAALHSLLPPRLVPPVAAHQLAPVDTRTPLQQEWKTVQFLSKYIG